MPRAARQLWTIVAAALAAVALAGCGGGSGSRERPIDGRPGVGSARALTVDRGGTVLIGTAQGLFRATPGGDLRLVGARGRDLTGLAATGDGALLGSGHPPPGRGPDDTGLLRSTDGGRTWRTMSLGGEAELHALRPTGRVLYALDATTGSLLASSDGGRRWSTRSTPPSLADFAVDPRDDERLVGSAGGRLWRSADGGRRWRPAAGPAGALAWAPDGSVLVATDAAELHASDDDARTWRSVGHLPAPVVALHADRDRLIGLAPDGTVVASTDGGRRWELVARP